MKKTELYKDINNQLSALLEGESDTIACMANMSALLYQSLEAINWAGFYLLRNEELILGPFQGKVACMHIALDKGVCGKCVSTSQIQCVDDVHTFPNHIACDGASLSEIVIPIYKDGKLFGVLDIDAPVYARFTVDDERGLAQCVKILEQHII